MNKFIFQLFTIVISFTLFSCQGISQNNNVPKEFLNHVPINKEAYRKDSIEILRQLRHSLKIHDDFFYSREYFESTEIIIDTIIYSPDFLKIVVFIMTKNPTSRQLVPKNDYSWYYDATCYAGIRQDDTISLSRIGPDFSNSVNRDKLTRMMRATYFTKFATLKDTGGNYRYKYNIGDVRFWDCPIWKEIEEEKIRKKQFEEEKR